MPDTRQRLVKGLARLEVLRERNDAQHEKLREGLAAMTDHATHYLDHERQTILSSDDLLTGLAGKRAAAERYRARQLLGDA